MSSPSILRPETAVPLKGGTITVRELPGLDALEFLELLAKLANSALIGALSVDANGKVSADITRIMPKLEELIRGSRELVTFLLTHAIADCDETKLRTYGATEMLALLDAALEVNLTPDLLKLGKKVGDRIGAFLVAGKNTTPKSATS